MARIGWRLYQKVARRAKHRCEYCRLPQAAEVMDFTVDHVVPKAAGGRSEFSNLALACLACNSKKWKFTHWFDPRDPEQKRDVPLFSPRKDRWRTHFAWAPDDPATIVGRTPIGRATIELLGMNSQRAVDIGRWLMLVNRHPPRDK